MFHRVPSYLKLRQDDEILFYCAGLIRNDNRYLVGFSFKTANVFRGGEQIADYDNFDSEHPIINSIFRMRKIINDSKPSLIRECGI